MNGPEIPKPTKEQPIGWWRKKTDALMQTVGKQKFPRSLISGKPTQVMHHFIEKSVSSILRYDWDNLIPLTDQEHKLVHQEIDSPLRKEIIRLKGQEWYNKLQIKRRQQNRVNVEFYRQNYIKLSAENVSPRRANF